MSRYSHLLVSLLICLLFISSYFTPSSSSQSTLRSLSLNGTNQYLTAPSSTTLNITGAITVEGWIKLNSTGAYQAIVSREAFQQAGTGGGYRLVVTDTGKLRLDLFQSHNTYTTVIGTTTITTGAWHHVAGVFDGSQMRVYLDGVLNGSVSTTNGPASGTGAFYIGRFSYSFNPYYVGGLIDEVRVSAAALYTSNFTPGTVAGSNVKGLWKFDGQTPNDSSGNGNNGTLQNGSTYSTDVPPATNNAPSVNLTHPLNNTNFAAGANIVMDATASDSDGTVSKVDFYQGTTLLGTDTTAPYAFVWTNVPAGSYSLTAKATDDGNATTTSSAVAVTVTAPGGPHSLSLNGTTASVDVPNHSTLNITGAITVEAWIKYNAIDGNYHDIVSRVDRNTAGSGGGYSLTVNPTGKLRLDLFQTHNTYTTLIGTSVMSTGVWHHVAGVFNGSQMRVYVDGVLDGSLNTTNAPGSGTSLLRIGKAAHAAGTAPLFLPSYAFAGLIDEVRVSAAALYTSNFTPGTVAGSNVKGLWKFDGQTSNDFSTNGNHGTVQNGATYSTDVPSISGGSQTPMAVANGPYSGEVNQSVAFSSSGSVDPGGSIVSYSWNFGDSTTASTANPSHTYAAPGLYTATLTVTDNSGLLASATAIVTVSSGNARLDPLNQTGGSGENPLSRNFNWTIPLVGLPGRAGLDLGLSLSYNSLVWTKSGTNYISFDDDHGFPGPGFRLGFPVIQALYFNSEVNKYAYLLLASDGTRTELRKVDASSLYEAADSSYLLLDASTMILRTTDGTQLKYELKGSEYQCTEIKDRNGNYITVNYTPFGRVDTVVDTLGRSIKFNYDANGWLTSITQIWNQGPSQVTHNWATFDYVNTTIQTSFTGLTVNGPSNNSTIKTLSKVTLADSSHYDFSYTSWGQVWKVSSFAADNHLLNYRSYNLPLTATAQTDCPRFTERRDWAEDWNENVSGVEQEAVTTYAEPTTETSSLIGGGSLTGVRAQITAPDLTSTKIYFVDPAETTSDWQRGLPALVNSYDSSGVLQRQVKTTWTQNNTSVSYPDNPRVTETNTYDPAGNRARVQITYQQQTFANGTSCQLPRDVYEYAANATTILRSTRTDYHTGTAYSDRRIIGLVTERRVYDGDVNAVTPVLMSKIGMYYDNENSSTSIQGMDAPIQHDNTNYTASFVTGRGNMSSMRRYDVTNIANFTTTRTKYNTAGSPVSTTDASNHTAQLNYADSFSDGNNSRNTLAYATTVTDPDSYTATVRYNFDFGVVTYRRTPQPNTTQNLPGPEQATTYDSIGRLQQVTNQVNGSYTRYVYPNTMTKVETYTTIQDSLGEAYSAKFTDGAGRVIATAATHPGSVGGYSGQKFVYDVMSRVIKTSNPTETSASGAPSQWVTAGDDAASSWIYSQQTYDWKGRPLVTTNQDGTTKTASYNGCGCAGGEVVTLTDEGTVHNGATKNRQRKVYSDVLGRTVKTELLNWANGSVYSATVNTYNARDQVTQIRKYAGAEGGGTYQDTTMAYDGYGRLQSKHVPEQNLNTATFWTYNAEDTIQSVTGANGSKTTFAYNNRRMVTNVSWTSPAPPANPLPTPAPVTLAYDAAGNRISMTDGFGSVSYEYSALSQMTAEIRTLTGVTNPSSSDGRFKLTYEYNLAGQLKKFTDATNMTLNYGYDLRGRLNGVTGADTLVGGVTTYASGFHYGAAATLRQVTTGNQTMTTAYNSRLQPLNFAINGTMVQQNYEYYADGRVSFVHNTTDNRFDRSYKYDHVGRLTTLYTGGDARQDFGEVPLSETFSYNEFDNLSGRVNLSWSNYYSDSATYTNHRRSDWSYDADGRVTTIGTRTYNYDAGGQIKSLTGQRWTPNGYVPTSIDSGFDGDGNRISEIANGTTTYFLRSTVFGAIVADLNNSGQKLAGYVFTPTGTLLANQTPAQNRVTFKLTSPVATSQYEHFVTDTTSGIGVRREFDPAGAIIPLVQHTFGHADTIGDLPGAGGGSSDGMFGSITSPAAGCTMDGVYVPCYMASRFLASGAAKFCPNNDCSPRRIDIDIRYKDGSTQSLTGLIADPFAIPDDFDHTWTGDAAQAAARAFNLGVDNRSFGTGAVWAIASGTAVENLKDAVPSERTRFGLAFNDMLKRFENPACAAALGGLTRIFEALSETNFRFDNLGYPSRQPGGRWEEPRTYARIRGNTVIINGFGRFMAVNGRLWFQKMNIPATVGATYVSEPDGSIAEKQIEGGDIAAASFILTHELGHRTGRLPADAFGGGGASGLELIRQAQNNERIYTTCGFDK